jgi:NAD(P)-dependent dehydrogenase (short-subunit alcohol dehydrogenase family)
MSTNGLADRSNESKAVSEQKILVTGVGGSIGSAIIRQLEQNGCTLAKLSQVGLANEGTIVEFRDDNALDRAVSEFHGKFDGVVLAHGISQIGKIHELSIPDLRKVLDVNLVSIFVILRAVSAKLKRGASVVVISSTASLDHSPVAGTHYTSSKYGLNGLVRHLAFEWGPRDIRINAVCPGYVGNPTGHSLRPLETMQKALAQIALGREATSEDVANMVRFLLSPQSSYVTGAFIPVSGGFQ